MGIPVKAGMVKKSDIKKVLANTAKWVSEDHGYALNSASGDELGAITAENPGMWYVYVPDEDWPQEGPFGSVFGAANFLEKLVGVSADQDILEDFEEGEEEGDPFGYGDDDEDDVYCQEDDDEGVGL